MKASKLQEFDPVKINQFSKSQYYHLKNWAHQYQSKIKHLI